MTLIEERLNMLRICVERYGYFILGDDSPNIANGTALGVPGLDEENKVWGHIIGKTTLEEFQEHQRELGLIAWTAEDAEGTTFYRAITE